MARDYGTQPWVIEQEAPDLWVQRWLARRVAETQADKKPKNTDPNIQVLF